MRKLSTAILTAVLAVSLSAYAVALDVYEIPQQTEIPTEAWGVLQVPCIRTNSPLYEGWQEVIDAEDSALVLRYEQGLLILDHAGSEVGRGYWCVEDMKVGCGAFLIREGKGAKCYECTAIYLCEQSGLNYLYRGQRVTPTRDGLMCVSCTERDGYVFVAVFDFIGDMP